MTQTPPAAKAVDEQALERVDAWWPAANYLSDNPLLAEPPRSHQVPLTRPMSDPEELEALEAWLASYRLNELFDATGALRPDLAALAPTGQWRR